MKTLPTLVAIALAVALVVAPLAGRAAGTITISSPTAGTNVPAGSYTIAGTVAPAPGQPDTVGITVKNPSATVVDTEQTSVNPSTGAWSLSAVAGGPLWTVGGTYTITATDSLGATPGSTSFTFTVKAPPQAGLALVLSAAAPSLLYAGQNAQVSVLATWNNGTAATGVTFTGSLISPSGSASPLTAAPTSPVSGVYWWSIPAPAANGLYAVVLGGSDASQGTTYKAWVQTSFTVNGQVANGGSLSKDLAGNFTALSSAIAAVNTAVGSVNTAVGSINTQIGNMQTQIANINTNVNNLAGLSGQISSAASSIGTTQTYVLVVAVLAAITLVLELAILVRKLS